MEDGIAQIVGGVIFAAIALAFIFMVGMVVVPIAVVGGGALWYMYNVRMPEKQRKETNERLDRLYAEAQRFAPSKKKMREELTAAGIDDAELLRVASVLFDQEGLEPPPPPPATADQIAAGKYQEQVQTFITAARGDRFNGFVRHLIAALEDFQSGGASEDYMFVSERERSREEIDRLMMAWLNDDGYFKTLIDTLNENYRREGEKLPSDSRYEDYAWRYLRDTPLLPLQYAVTWTGLQNRMYHTYLLGSSGSGKTKLLENIIAHDLQSDDDPCVVVIDSQTQLTKKLAHLDIPDTAYFTPQYDLALNLFEVGYEDMRSQGVEGETLINRTVGLLSFVMEGMMGTGFTSPQKTIFQYGIQLVITIKGGNIFTFMEILSEGGLDKYQAEIARLDDNSRRFFEVDFGSDEYKRSREAIRRRLDSLLLNPTFRRLFGATENNINMAAELENRKLILIDTNKPMLDADASAFFGRLFIAMIVRASYQRFGKGHWMRPVHLIVDEAHEYFDQSIADMLEQARKANIGLLVAHQSLSQAKGRGSDANIIDPLMVNTATKIIWTTYRDDAAKFAGSMRVTPETILDLPQFTFGLHSRKQGFRSIRGFPDPLDGLFPQRADVGHLRDEMELAYGSRKHTSAAAETEPVKEEVLKKTDTPQPTDEPRLPPEHRERKKRPPPPDDVDMI
jgi:hypothetical protein